MHTVMKKGHVYKHCNQEKLMLIEIRFLLNELKMYSMYLVYVRTTPNVLITQLFYQNHLWKSPINYDVHLWIIKNRKLNNIKFCVHHIWISLSMRNTRQFWYCNLVKLLCTSAPERRSYKNVCCICIWVGFDDRILHQTSR